MLTSEALQISKDYLVTHGWTYNRPFDEDGRACAMAAIIYSRPSYVERLEWKREEALDVLAGILEKRYHQGKLASPIFSGGGRQPVSWDELFGQPYAFGSLRN